MILSPFLLKQPFTGGGGNFFFLLRPRAGFIVIQIGHRFLTRHSILRARSPFRKFVVFFNRIEKTRIKEEAKQDLTWRTRPRVAGENAKGDGTYDDAVRVYNIACELNRAYGAERV